MKKKKLYQLIIYFTSINDKKEAVTEGLVACAAAHARSKFNFICAASALVLRLDLSNGLSNKGL